MLKPQDIEIELFIGPEGESIKIMHKPTGIFRGKGSPLTKRGKLQQEMMREIEAELVERGLTQYVLPNRNSGK